MGESIFLNTQFHKDDLDKQKKAVWLVFPWVSEEKPVYK